MGTHERQLGKHESAVRVDSPSQARCINWGRKVEIRCKGRCPRHNAATYAGRHDFLGVL